MMMMMPRSCLAVIGYAGSSKQFCLESSLECQQRWRRCDMLLTVAVVNGRQFLPRDAIMLVLHTIIPTLCSLVIKYIFREAVLRRLACRAPPDPPPS